jgi:hypothetical protein
MLVAAVLGACPADDQCMQTAVRQLQDAPAVHFCTAQGTYEATLGVLGVWAASCPDAAAAMAAAAALVCHSAVSGANDSVLLAMFGSRCFVPALQLSGWGSTAQQQLWAPECSFQHSHLPPGTTDVQVKPQYMHSRSDADAAVVVCASFGNTNQYTNTGVASAALAAKENSFFTPQHLLPAL